MGRWVTLSSLTCAIHHLEGVSVCMTREYSENRVTVLAYDVDQSVIVLCPHERVTSAILVKSNWGVDNEEYLQRGRGQGWF